MLDNMIRLTTLQGMNKLPTLKRVQILSMLCEGSSMRSVARVADVSINTVSKLFVDAGRACATFHDQNVRQVKAERIQCDEIWSFCYSKAANVPIEKHGELGAGDVWTWTALEADSKLIVSWLVGRRDGYAAYEFLTDLRSRLANRVQLTSDAFRGYQAVGATFGDDVDYAQLVKQYGPSIESERRYSPPVCVGAKKHPIRGKPDPKHISTSFVERQNLTMRMSMRRFTRLTNAFSKKFENHCHALALYFVHYNWCRLHKTHRMTPAMAAGLTGKLMDMSDIVRLIDQAEIQRRVPTIAKRALL
jgi:IS1 family transposase